MMRVRRQSVPGTAALFAAVAILALTAPAGVHPARADTAIVRQDATPIVSRPGVGGRILARVDAGFDLTVLGREGDWLKVASPQLNLVGELWVPAARVGDIVAAPTDLAPSEPASAMTAAPQFRITSDASDSMSASSLSLGTATTAGPRNSGGVPAAVTRSSSATVTRSASVNAAGSATTQATVSATPAAGDVTPPSDNPTPAPGNPTPTVDSSPTPALGNPTPAVSGNATPAPGNPTPAMGNAVSGFSGSSVTSP